MRMLSRAAAIAALLTGALPLAAQDAAPALRGTLRDSLGRPLPQVEVSYLKITTLTDSLGNFRLSPVPTGRIAVRFSRNGAFIGEVQANVTSDTTTGVQVDVVGERGEPRSFSGVVVDADGKPSKNVLVEVVTALRETQTDSAGRFVLKDLPARRHFVRVRRVGYAPTFLAVDLTDSVSRRARIVLRQYAGQNLGLVVVRADRTNARMSAFLERAQKKSGWGRIISEDEIALRNPMRPSDLFQAVAGVRVSLDRFGRGVLTGRGGCLMALYINGFPTPQQTGSGIDDLVSTLDLAGIEIYNGLGGVPSDLMMGPPNACGTVGVWTK